MKTRLAALAAVLLLAPPATAQTILQSPPEQRHWDVAGHTGWLGGNKSEFADNWNDWFDAWAGGVSVGRYLTPHVKAELDATFGAKATVYGNELLQVPGSSFPVYRQRVDEFTTSMASGSVAYQFRENQWLHPYLGAGVEVVRERQRTEIPQQFIYSREPLTPPTIMPASTTPPRVTWSAHPFVTAGLKLYVAEQAFVRSELRTSFSQHGAAYGRLTIGFGVDL